MDKQAILNFIQTFKFQDKPTQYSKFYSTYTQEIPSLIPSVHTNEVNFYITDEMFHDNKVTEQFLIDHLRAANELHIRNDEMVALSGIINCDYLCYSEKNVLNKPFMKESLQEAIINVLRVLNHNGIPLMKPKALLVSTELMFLAKELLADGLCEYFPQNLIVNPYIRSNTFAAIITDAPNSFRHYVKKPMELSVEVKRLTHEIEVKISSERFFEVGNPMGIYTISF